MGHTGRLRPGGTLQAMNTLDIIGLIAVSLIALSALLTRVRS